MEEIIQNQKESIKLMKMSKGYNWEIKLLGEPFVDEQIIRLDKIDKDLREKYGDVIPLNKSEIKTS